MKILILTFLILSFNLHAQTLSQRLLSDVDKLQAKMASAEELLKNGGRDEAFRLQAFGRLFENDLKGMKELKEASKELEDQIGQCKKWSDLLETTSKTVNKPLYQKNLEIETAKLTKLLNKWNDKNKMDKLRSTISDIDLDVEETLALADKNISKSLKDLMDKKFDFKFGETGLHELRRHIRWPKIYFELFSDRIFLKPTAKCSISYNNLFEIGLPKKKIIFQGKPETEITLVFKECAYIKLLGAVELLGNIKDELERSEVLDDKLPKDLRDRVIVIYNEIVEQVLSKL